MDFADFDSSEVLKRLAKNRKRPQSTTSSGREMEALSTELTFRPDAPDIETFYTPEMQEQVLAEFTRQAQEANQQRQAGISGAAIRSGFGVGGTSREMTRRARSDAKMLDDIVNATVQQAQTIQEMRTAQQQQDAAQKQESVQGIQDAFQDVDLRRQGFAEGINRQHRANFDASRAQRDEILFGGLGSLAGAAGGFFGSLGGGKSGRQSLNVNRPEYMTQGRLF